MSDSVNKGMYFMGEQQIEKLEEEFKTWVKEFGAGIQRIVTTEIKALTTIIETHMKTNETEHSTIRAEMSHFRKIDDDIYNKIDAIKDSTDNKVTAVRLDLQAKIDSNAKGIELNKNAPGIRAQKLISTIANGIIMLLLGASFTALIFWLSSGGSK